MGVWFFLIASLLGLFDASIYSDGCSVVDYRNNSSCPLYVPYLVGFFIDAAWLGRVSSLFKPRGFK